MSYFVFKIFEEQIKNRGKKKSPTNLLVHFDRPKVGHGITKLKNQGISWTRFSYGALSENLLPNSFWLFNRIQFLVVVRLGAHVLAGCHPGPLSALDATLNSVPHGSCNLSARQCQTRRVLNTAGEGVAGRERPVCLGIMTLK